ncbi:oligopeptide transport system permease protein [Pullulanibacillus pueri]|uniref:Peptide ABC transporter permease n=1 Tax=Pullulanibacillus pueri TaxID=1437324 RepID=A0A8J3A0G6_9BACL|nr:oligopeptide ABC transporter permease [Pullulanibacillus pueri]MBM7680582.1 oligopeptide transport system permease protein [Pullulanibacillus pueri]GGH88743.1 peptide ABC transporter permease [Pullulanibacillus pueri]
MSGQNELITKDMFAPAEIDASQSEEIRRETVSYWKDAFRRLRKNKGAIAGAIIIFIIIIMAIIGPYFNKYGVDDQDIMRTNAPPKIGFLSNVHWLPFDGYEKGRDVYAEKKITDNFWFGTDKLGRDQWTRIWLGTRVSLFIGVIATLADLIIGVAYGGISGYFGGKVDTILQRIYEILVGIPQLILVILLIMIMNPGITTIILAIGVTGWLGMSRLIRGQVLQLKSLEYVLAAKTLGASDSRIIAKHMVPNTLGLIIVHTMFSVPSAIFFEAFLSFIGLGMSPPKASLGVLIQQGYESIQFHPYLALYPGLIICLLLICFNIFGDGLRDALDPRLRK